jgi:hypothetical protein
MWPAFPTSEYYGGSAPPSPFGRRWTYPDRRTSRPTAGTSTRRFPCSLWFAQPTRSPALPQRPRHAYAADLQRGLPGPLLHRPEKFTATPPGQRLRTAPGPHPPDSSRYSVEGRYNTGSSRTPLGQRSPGPHHLAVLTHPGFVRAAPTLPGTSRIRLPPAPTRPLRRPGDAGLSPPLEPQRLTAHEEGPERLRHHLQRPRHRRPQLVHSRQLHR